MEDHTNNHRKFIILMIVLLIVFAIIFLLAFAGLQTKRALFGIEGLPVEFENWLIMILSLGSIIKIVWELFNYKKQ